MKYKKWSLEEKFEILASSTEIGAVETSRKDMDGVIPRNPTFTKIDTLIGLIYDMRLEIEHIGATLHIKTSPKYDKNRIAHTSIPMGRYRRNIDNYERPL